jgi:hypothetical protein
MAPFERMGDVPAIYGLDGQSFMAEVERAIQSRPEESTE